MGILEYVSSRTLSHTAHSMSGNAFYSLLMATIREAGSEELERLESAFPDTVAELRKRYNAPGGALTPEETEYMTNMMEATDD